MNIKISTNIRNQVSSPIVSGRKAAVMCTLHWFHLMWSKNITSALGLPIYSRRPPVPLLSGICSGRLSGSCCRRGSTLALALALEQADILVTHRPLCP